MYEEIDTSGQAKWNLPTILGFILVVGLLIIRLFGYPLGDPPYQVDLYYIVALGPVGVCLLGGLFGILKKRTIKVNPHRLEFIEDVRNLNDFGRVYHEGDFRTGVLGGHPAYLCGWSFTVLFSFAIGLVVIFTMATNLFFPVLVIEVILSSIFYIAGFVTAFRGMPIRNEMVQNPLQVTVSRNLSKYQAIQWLTECDLVSKIIVRYRVGIGQTLKVIDDIRVLAITATEPSLEVEITIENMENVGPEYTYYLSEGRPSLKEEKIDVAGKEVRLIIDEIDMKKYIQVCYAGTLRSRFHLGSPERQCNLMHALVDEVSKNIPITKIPEIEDSVSDE